MKTRTHLTIFLFWLACLAQLKANNGLDSVRIQGYLAALEINEQKERIDSALLICDDIIALVESSIDKTAKAKIYRQVGFFYERHSQLQKAAYCYQKAIVLADSLPYELKLSVFIDWAIINRSLNQYKISREYYNKVILEANEKRDSAMLFHAYNGLGGLNEFLGVYNIAVDDYLKAIECAEKSKNFKDAIITLINTATVFTKGKNYTLANQYIGKAHTLAQNVGDSTHLGLLYDIWARIHAEQNDLKKAIDYQLIAVSCFESGYQKEFLGRTLLHLADIYTQVNDYNLAEKNLNRCLALKSNLNLYDQPTLYLRLGKLYQYKKQHTAAIAAYKKGFEIAKAYNLKDLIQQASSSLSKLYQTEGQLASALYYSNITIAYQDSIFNDNQARLLVEAQYKFDIEKAESQLKYEQNLHQSQLLDIQRRQNIYWLLAFLAILVSVTIVLVYLVRVKHTYNRELLIKNQEISLKNDRLTQSNEVLKQFAYASAHDLKEPLRSISSFVSIIKRRYISQLPPEALEYFEFVMTGVNRLDTLLAALLTYSTLASEKEDMEEKTDLVKVLEDVKTNLSKTISDKNAVIEVTSNLPNLSISYLHLVQLLQNLISNALKFSDKIPHIVINTTIEDKQCVISIQDNGIGMKREYSDKIFLLFQRLSRATQYEGAGIGLAICRQIVEKYNGKIWFESDEGIGTTFFVSFPITYMAYENSLTPLELLEV